MNFGNAGGLVVARLDLSKVPEFRPKIAVSESLETVRKLAIGPKSASRNSDLGEVSGRDQPQDAKIRLIAEIS